MKRETKIDRFPGLRAAGVVALLLAANLLPAVAMAEQDETPDKNITLAVVLFPGFELLDVMGPLEMFCNVGPKLKVVLVAEKAGVVPSAQKVSTVADYSFADCPEIDVIMVPGGRGVRPFIKNEKAMAWLVERAADADIVSSVCTGAAILSEAGLLDGYRATTNKLSFGLVAANGPKVEWVRRARWVDDGDRVTSSGVSAGMDMALHLIERLYGEKVANRVMAGTEYNWQRDPDVDPFARIPE